MLDRYIENEKSLAKAIVAVALDDYCDAKFALADPMLPPELRAQAWMEVEDVVVFLHSERFDTLTGYESPYSPEDIISLLNEKVRKGDRTRFYVPRS